MSLSSRLRHRFNLKQALCALSALPNVRVVDTTSFDIASLIKRILHRLRAPPD
ncbi:hypothetical protein JDN40_02250 [Rhodomicrobium vannielii ATCC 17100]|uniref:hypothetical protein n=1 Tax=Rhodomicrobium vannielii TaxID=1069 RepID=UPI00191A1ECC|nr:hypothetical protein [Rhodomicrobium vannielii]MBJ7532936.1 hypothetical protein [Rhodomicrobium vannielii ATCC 17100]